MMKHKKNKKKPRAPLQIFTGRMTPDKPNGWPNGGIHVDVQHGEKRLVILAAGLGAPVETLLLNGLQLAQQMLQTAAASASPRAKKKAKR